MQFIDYISNLAMPMIILVIVVYAIYEKKKVFDNFIVGAKEGLEVIISIFPTLLGLFIAIGTLRASGILELISSLLGPALSVINFPTELLPLAILRPLSGSGAIAIATDIMQNYGVDSTLGMMASTIMGSTETTLYTLVLYTSCVKIKKVRFVLGAALIADLVGIVSSVIIYQIIK